MRHGRATPLIVLVEFSGRPALLVPLYRRTLLPGLSKAVFMGDKHANVRVPLVTRHRVDRASLVLLARDGWLVTMIADALKDGGQADLLALECLPESYGGESNLLTEGAHEPCGSLLFAGQLQADFERFDHGTASLKLAAQASQADAQAGLAGRIPA
jgi:hypothetical protein